MRGIGVGKSMGGLPRTFGLQRQASAGHDGEPIKVSRARIGRALRHFKPYWPQWLVILFCIAVTSGLGVLPPLCVRSIIDNAIPGKNAHLLYLLVAAIIGLTVATSLIGVVQNLFNMRVGQRVMFDLRNQLYQHLQRQSLGFYTTTRAGEIVSRLNNDVAAVREVATGTLVQIASNLFTLTATLIAIFSMDPWLALIAIIVVPTFYAPTRYVGRIRRRLSLATQEQQAEMVAFMEERLNIGGMMLTKIFGQAASEAEGFAERGKSVMDLSVKQAMAGRWLFAVLAVFSVLGPASIYCYGGLQAIRGDLKIGTIIAFVAYLGNLYRPVGQLSNFYVSLQGALSVFERIYEYLDRKPEVEDRPDAVALDDIRGHVRFDHVDFEYPRPTVPFGNGNGTAEKGNAARKGKAGEKEAVAEQEAPKPEAQEEDRRALRDVSFEMRPGERVALVGPSGAGKTTITYLLPRFYDPASGRVTLDGHDLREITQDSLRAHIGAVTQDTFLFHATIRDNLLYARPGATDDQVVAAARAANIHDFVLGLPEGYDTIVGERGFRLSGGEKQRLAIARALLKDPKILVLDEATSNLDATSEYLIQQALETLLKGRTALIIAHRLSTILNADKILVLDKGRIVEEGPHSELVAKGGLYATLYYQQFARVVEEAEAHRRAQAGN